MVGKYLNQFARPNIRADIQFRLEHDPVTRQTPSPYQRAVIGHPVAAHGDGLLKGVGSKPPHVVQSPAKAHDQTIVILQIDRFFRGAMAIKMARCGTQQASSQPQASHAQ